MGRDNLRFNRRNRLAGLSYKLGVFSQIVRDGSSQTMLYSQRAKVHQRRLARLDISCDRPIGPPDGRRFVR
jgi:hypothetical protein